MRYRDARGDQCAIAQALGVVGDWWTLLIVRDIAGGLTRFDSLQHELGVSRKVLAQRLRHLIEHEVIAAVRYSERPPRHEYVLTEAGFGLLPVLVALQNWGGQHVLGDGELTATSRDGSAEAQRVHALAGCSIPALTLPAADGAAYDPVAASRWTILYFYPGAYAPHENGYPPGWAEIPGAAGCTLETRTYRDRLPEIMAYDAAVYGVSTQRPDQLLNFASHEKVPFPLLSDAEARLTAALRLPTFRAAGVDRLKRLTVVVDHTRRIRHVVYPVADVVASVQEAIDRVADLSTRDTTLQP
jgi:DNA-binding HxlR family transcriptional regulator/peroxiredoxin